MRGSSTDPVRQFSRWRRSVLVGLALSVGAATAAPGSGQEFATEAPFSGFSIVTDQDLFVDWFDNQDRNYTMGLGFQARGRSLARFPLNRMHHWLDGLLGLGPDPSTDSYHSLMLAGAGYTPDSLLATEPVVGDRPYAGLVNLHSRRVQVRGDTRQWAVATELILGALGTPIPGKVQYWIHEHISGSDLPQGWHVEISDGGEPTGAYHVSVDRRLTAEPPTDESIHFEVAAGAEAWAGYYTNAAFGTRVRLGWFYSEFWEFMGSPLGGVQQATGEGGAPSWELFAFGGIQGRVVGYNALLQGQFRESAYTLSSEEINRFLGEFSFGLHASRTLRGGWNAHATWVALAGRSAEFDTAYSRDHFWGSAYIGFSRSMSLTSRE